MKVVVVLENGEQYEISSVKETKLVDSQGRERLTAKQTKFGILTETPDKK